MAAAAPGPSAPLPSRSHRDGSHTATQGAAQGRCFLQLLSFIFLISRIFSSTERLERGLDLLTVTPHGEEDRPIGRFYSRHRLHFSHQQIEDKKDENICLVKNAVCIPLHTVRKKHVVYVVEILPQFPFPYRQAYGECVEGTFGRSDVRWQYDEGFGFGVFQHLGSLTFIYFVDYWGCLHVYVCSQCQMIITSLSIYFLSFCISSISLT